MLIDAFRLRHLAACVEKQSQDPAILDQVLHRTGLSRDDIAEPNTVEALKEPTFVMEACDLLGDPTFAVKAGLEFRDGTNLTSYIAKYSQNLRGAIENSQRYYSTFDPAFSYSLNVSSNAASFSLSCNDATFSMFHRHKEFLLFGALARGRSLTGTDFYPIEMRFSHGAKSIAEEIVRLAQCPVVFSAENTEIILPLATLKLPIPTFDPNLRNHLIEYADRLLADAPETTLSLEIKVKSILLSCLPNHIPTSDEVALSLGMSKRTFARNLADESTHFRKIVEEVRFALAKNYLEDSFSISEIAFSLAYSDQASFSTAFRRWTGCSPKEYRDSKMRKGD